MPCTFLMISHRISYSAPSYCCWLFGNKLPTAHKALSAAFNWINFTTYSCWQRHFEQICLRWRNEHLRPRMLLFSVGNGHGQWRYERSEILATAQCLDQCQYTTFSYPYAYSFSLSSLFVACIIVQYILSYIACLCKLKGGGGRGLTSLFHSKCKHCSAVDNGAMNFIPALVICFQIANQKT